MWHYPNGLLVTLAMGISLRPLSSIQLFNKHCLTTYDLSNTLLGPGEKEIRKPCLQGNCSLKTRYRYINKGMQKRVMSYLKSKF